MSDLSKWDFIDEFTMEQAAFLIEGIDPCTATDIDRAAVEPIVKGIHRSYDYAVSYFLDEFEPALVAKYETEMLRNNLMIEGDHGNVDYFDLADHLRNCKSSPHDDQQFHRQEIARWLADNKRQSVYEFNRWQLTATPTKAGHWPWGSYTTYLLGHLEDAAKEFWLSYDPADPSTAPKNEVVSNWLMESWKDRNRGRISKEKADAIASILRADGLKTGPKKKLPHPTEVSIDKA